MFGTPSLSARCDSVTTSRSANPFWRLTPPPTSTAYFSRKRNPGVVRRVSRIRVLVPFTALANLAVWLAIPDRCWRKFKAVRSARRTLTAGPETRATSWPPASAMPSVARGSKLMLLSTSSNTRLKIGRPASTPSSLAISLPRALTLPGKSDSVVRSPSPMSSASASLINLSTALMGKRMVTTGTAAGRGCGAGAGGGTGAGRGGLSGRGAGGGPGGGRGDPRPRIVGRGKGMMGTPGASGGCTGAGWATGGVLTTGLSARGWLRGAVVLGRAAPDAVFRATDDPFLAGDATLGRADLAVGFPLTFEVVTRPFAFERRSELRGAPLPIPRYRSI